MLLAVLSAAVAAAASPVTTGEKTVASYCSPSGDVCYGVFIRGGKAHLRVTTAASVTWKLSSGPLGPSLDPA